MLCCATVSTHRLKKTKRIEELGGWLPACGVESRVIIPALSGGRPTTLLSVSMFMFVKTREKTGFRGTDRCVLLLQPFRPLSLAA